jgi:hypothetical protein
VGAALIAGWIAVFLQRYYPSWLFSAHTAALDWGSRAWAYIFLLTDRFPSFERGDYPARVDFDQPPGDRQLSRWRVLVFKAVVLIPHIVILVALYIAVAVVVLIAWFAILFTGRYPRGLFDFVVGVQNWGYRVYAYLASFHDEYPPFALG